MTHIIHSIYLGDKEDAHNESFVNLYKIGTIINVTKDVKNKFNDRNIQYYNVKIDDALNVRIFERFEDITKIIHDNKDDCILVHCSMGKSRSASFIIAYLIKYQNMNLKDALKFVKDKREIIQPNFIFFEQLIEWEKHVLGTNSITILEYMGKTEKQYRDFVGFLKI
jgi:protein-tyrosine phosphatase